MGSVRRARERVEQGLPPIAPQPPQQRPYESPRSTPIQPSNRQRPQMPQGLQSRNGPIGVSISRPTQVPQWPLTGTIEGTPEPTSNQQYQPPAGRANPPQRPPRPSHVPSMLDASRLQEHTPSFQYAPQPQEQNQNRSQFYDDDSIITSPVTPSSRQSTNSSVGTIPDFPVPMPPPPQIALGRRSGGTLGPPPTARRGASSYYSQASYVSPIPEESPRSVPASHLSQASHGSYASSAAIPTSWGEGGESPGYDEEYESEGHLYDGRGYGPAYTSFGHETIEEGRESRESHNTSMDDNDDRGLIRSASLGKRAKPSMITTKSSGSLHQPSPQDTQQPNMEDMGIIEGAAIGAIAGSALANSRKDGQRENKWPIMGDRDSPLAGGTGFIESASSSGSSLPQVARAVTADEAVPPSASPSANATLGPYGVTSALRPGVPIPARTPSPGFSRLSAIRRPPRIDIDAVRDAEARGSLTSLPDLIRRATRLAAMMDRGKRPGSRLNDLTDFPSEGDIEKSRELDGKRFKHPLKFTTNSTDLDRKRHSGLSGMLAAFPPPGLATPTRDGNGTPRDGNRRPVSAWPSPYDPYSAGMREKDGNGNDKRRRRCCGLPVWGFLLVLLILLIIIAAAVVVPLELLVIHKPKNTSAAMGTGSTTALSMCESNNATECLNGGTSMVTSDGGCSCLCINGFTGPTCTIGGSTGCTTTTLSGVSNVTLGDSIPRLISFAQTNFSVPLFSNVILARFNSANLSCISENALVTFDGLDQRVGDADSVATATATLNPRVTSAPLQLFQLPANNHRRYTDTEGIVGDTSSLSFPTSTPNPSAAASSSTSTLPLPSSSTSSGASSTPTSSSSPFIVTQQVLDFARVSVLFVLQQQDLNTASNAQTFFQYFFDKSPTENEALNVTLGGGNSADLMSLTLIITNGSWYGNSSSKSSGTTASKRNVSGRSVDLLDYI
jgi:hypothetical protein